MALTEIPIELSSTPSIVDGGNATAITIDASENVGIGTSAITSNTILHMKDTDTQIELESTNGSNSAFIDFDGTNLQLSANRNMVDGAFSNTGKSAAGIFLNGPSGGSTITFATASANNTTPTTRMTIDSAGNLLVGTSTTNIATEGTVIYGSGNEGVMTLSSTNMTALYVNRSTDGELVQFRKGGSAVVGSIATWDGEIAIGRQNCALLFDDDANRIKPHSVASNTVRDNALDLGGPSARFDDIYATNGTIQTSDRNEKQDIAELTDAEQRVAVAAKGLLRKFRWIDAVEAKGDDARIHFGIIAQDLQAAFEAEGLDAARYAMFTSNTWTDEDTGEERTRLGVRYSELLAFIISAI